LATDKLTRAYLVAVREKKISVGDAEAELDEFAALAASLGLTVVGQTLQRVSAFNPKYLIGAGLAESLHDKLAALDAGLLLVDGDLSAAQERNLTAATKAKIFTRTDVILEIFARRAGTREGKLQVELAKLEYALPRMVGLWTHFGRAGSGIGGRGGAGETQLEIDRRRARQRIAALKRELQTVRRVRAEHRKQRVRNAVPVFALVGYTNAGKSSLLNRLTDAGALAANQLFATLDPLTEKLVLPSRQNVLVSDTVGFIRRLPHSLVDAFRATLEEVAQADVLLHVADAADPEIETKLATVREVLEQIGAGGTPAILVLNKADLLDERDPELLAKGERAVVAVSARTGAGIAGLLAAMDVAIDDRLRRVNMLVPYGEGKALADILAHGEIVSRKDLDDGVELDVRVSRVLAGRYKQFVTPDRVRSVAP
jgi:GTP-binding protein HflX